jgi:hypothetical protein
MFNRDKADSYLREAPKMFTRSGRPGTAAGGYASRKLAPVVEVFERREMLDAGFGTIAGTAFIDSNGDGALGVNDPYLAGATVELFRVGSTTPIATQVTNAQGGYSFVGLSAGQYVVAEIPPAGYTNSAAQALSQLQPSVVAGTNAVVVTVPQASNVYLNYNGVNANTFQVMNNLVNGSAELDSVGPFQATLGTTPGGTDLSGGIQTFCMDDLSRISFGGAEQFKVVPKAITDASNGTTTIPADRAGRIAFLYNHFGTSSLPNIQGPALQLAIWELLYDTSPTPDFSAGNFQVVSPDTTYTSQAVLDQVIAQAKAYFNMSAGKSEAAILLDASGNGPDPGTGFQSMLVTGSYNFGNRSNVAQPSSISGYVYCDPDNDGIKQPGEMPISGVTVTLTGSTTTGQPVDLVTKTDQSGFYQFLNLQPGVYTITKTPPAGYTDGKTTQGTPGTGFVSGDSIQQITLAANVNGVNNNFAELAVPAQVTQLQLFGIHMQTSQVVLHFNGAVEPAVAQNPANYRLIGLGKDDTLGTADDQYYAITSAVYNASANTVTLTPSAHLNIHYYYALTMSYPTTACTAALQYANVFGRSSVPVFNIHGVPTTPPAMYAWEVQRQNAVVSKTLPLLNGGMNAAFASGVKSMQVVGSSSSKLWK